MRRYIPASLGASNTMKLKKTMTALVDGTGLDALCGVIVTAVMTGIVALTVVDVVARYWFNESIEGGFEITELLLVLLIFSALPLVSRRNAHVTVDLVEHFLSGSVRRISDILNHIVTGLVFLAMAYFLWRHAARLEEYNDVTAILHVALYPFVYAISVFSAIGAVIHFAMAVIRLRKSSPSDLSRLQ